MWSTLLLFPADVAKIRLQAEADAHEEAEAEEEGGSSPLGAAAIEAPTSGAGGGGAKGGHTKAGGGGPKSFLGEILVVLKRPDLWYAGLGKSCMCVFAPADGRCFRVCALAASC